MKHSAYYILCALVLTANGGWAREDGVRETVAYLSSLGSRVSGYPGAAVPPRITSSSACARLGLPEVDARIL